MLKDLTRLERLQIYISLFLRTTLIIAIWGAAWDNNWLLVFMSSAIFILTFLPSIVARNRKFVLPVELEFSAIVFIYAALFLGELRNYYDIYHWWDIMLHGFSSIILGFIGFVIIYTLHERNKIAASPIIIAIFAFCFSMAIGAVWEIYEFVMDSFFQWNMQPGGLVDTMWDLIIDALGSLFIATVGYFYIRGRPSRIIRPMMRKIIEKNPHLIKKN